MKLTGIKETCLYIKNIERTKEFYHGILGLEIFLSTKTHVFFKIGNSMLLCFLNAFAKTQEHLPKHFAEGSIHFAFETTMTGYKNCKGEIMENGINIEHEQVWKNGRKSFYFRDPDNNLVEILQPGIWVKD